MVVSERRTLGARSLSLYSLWSVDVDQLKYQQFSYNIFCVLLDIVDNLSISIMTLGDDKVLNTWDTWCIRQRYETDRINEGKGRQKRVKCDH